MSHTMFGYECCTRSDNMSVARGAASVVAQHEVRLEPPLVRQPSAAALDVAGSQRIDRGLSRRGAGADREVDAFEPDARCQAEPGRVPGDQQPVGGELGHGVVAAFGDQVRGVLLELAARDERCDRRMRLHRVDELLGPDARPSPAR